MDSWQTPVALAVVALAVLLAAKTLVWPFVQSMKTQPKDGCGGGCGCAKTACGSPKESANKN